MSLTPATIEDAIVAKLSADATLIALGVRVELFDADLGRARKGGATPKLPAILVCYLGGQVKPKGMYTVEDLADFQVSVVARNLRSVRGGRVTIETDGDVLVTAGAENILWRVRQLLTGATLELDMDELVPVEISLTEYEPDKRVVEYTSLWRTKVIFDLTDADHEEAGTVSDLSTVTAAINLDETEIVIDTHTDLES